MYAVCHEGLQLRVLDGPIQGKQYRERPRNIYTTQTCKDVEEGGGQTYELKRSAENRVRHEQTRIRRERRRRVRSRRKEEEEEQL